MGGLQNGCEGRVRLRKSTWALEVFTTSATPDGYSHDIRHQLTGPIVAQVVTSLMHREHIDDPAVDLR